MNLKSPFLKKVSIIPEERNDSKFSFNTLSFSSLLHDWEQSGNVQLIIATHSSILLSYPNARIIEFSDDGLREVQYEDTEHYKMTKAFMVNPDRFLKELMS